MGSGERRRVDGALDATTVDATAEGRTMAETRAPCLTIACHPDLARVGERAVLAAWVAGRPVALSRREPLFGPAGAAPDSPLADGRLSRSPITLEPADGDGLAMACNSPAAAPIVDGQSLDGRLVLGPQALDRGVVLMLAERVVLLVHWVRPLQARCSSELSLVGESDAMHRLRRNIVQLAGHDIPVLLRGESGTGKELVARALHEHGERCAQPFVSVNMAAIPTTMAASALFGHAKGAFTGAEQSSRGYFGAADGGTLFLDEIGDAPFDVQAALLRALETGEVQPVGAELPRRHAVRVVAATDSDLESAVEAGRFRLSLLKRLGGYELCVPPLRERREDIARLLLHFLREELTAVGRLERLKPASPRQTPWLPAWLMAAAVAHDWPGNVRELRNFARQLVVGWVDVPQVPRDPAIDKVLGLAAVRPRPTPATAAARTARRMVDEIDEAEVLAALRAHGFRPTAAARALGISRTSLFKLMKKLPNVRNAAELSRDEIARCLARVDHDVSRAAELLEVSERALRMRMKTLGLP